MSNRTLEINGYKLEIGAISPLAPKALENRYRKQNPEPKRPSYEVDAAGGITETFFHTLESVSTDEERKALADYEEKFSEWSAGLTFKLLRLFLSLGVKLKLTPKQEKELEAQMGALEIDVPETEVEKNLFYLETFVLSNPSSMEKVIQAVLDATGINSAAVEAAEATFPV